MNNVNVNLYSYYNNNVFLQNFTKAIRYKFSAWLAKMLYFFIIQVLM